MPLPKCEYCLTQGMLPVRKLEPGCVFCMTLWRDVRPEESCWDCASNGNYAGEEESMLRASS